MADILIQRVAKCPYCDKRVAMSSAILGEHNTHGGHCDGSGKRAVSMDSSGRAVLTMALLSVKDFKPGDRVRNYSGQRGVVEEITATNLVLVQYDDGHAEANDPKLLSKA